MQNTFMYCAETHERICQAYFDRLYVYHMNVYCASSIPKLLNHITYLLPGSWCDNFGTEGDDLLTGNGICLTFVFVSYCYVGVVTQRIQIFILLLFLDILYIQEKRNFQYYDLH